MFSIPVTTTRTEQIIDVTSLVRNAIPKDMRDGVCMVFCPHTTAGLTVNENYDPDVKHDVLEKLRLLVPRDESFYQHCEGNSDAHLKTILTGTSVTVPVENGDLALGTWQGIWFCEYDGPRSRKINVLYRKFD